MTRALVASLSIFAAGCCSTPCARTAKHLVGMSRSCIEVGDDALRERCKAAHASVREELTTGVCKAEVAGE